MRTFLLLSLFLSACTQPHVKKYADILEPKIGAASKEEISKILGAPIFCHQDVEYEKCEYRTPRARNTPVAAVYQQNLSLGPDLSPFEQFDVLFLRFDGLGVLRSWHPEQVN